MKAFIKRNLQRCLGYNNYLRAFAHFKIATLRVDPRDSDFIKFIELLSKDDVVIEIGANLGYMTVYISRAVPAGQVLAIEPIPDNVKTLKRMVEFYKCDNVAIEDSAIGATTGVCQMTVPVINGALQQGLSHIIQQGSKPDGIKVRMETLDEIVARRYPTAKVSAIKLDVEDHESEVLKGGMSTIANCRPIIYTELWASSNKVQFMDIILAQNYDAYVFEGGQIVKYSTELHSGVSNYFFLPRERVGKIIVGK
jgi:FkbM family methyltransferase